MWCRHFLPTWYSFFCFMLCISLFLLIFAIESKSSHRRLALQRTWRKSVWHLSWNWNVEVSSQLGWWQWRSRMWLLYPFARAWYIQLRGLLLHYQLAGTFHNLSSDNGNSSHAFPLLFIANFWESVSMYHDDMETEVCSFYRNDLRCKPVPTWLTRSQIVAVW